MESKTTPLNSQTDSLAAQPYNDPEPPGGSSTSHEAVDVATEPQMPPKSQNDVAHVTNSPSTRPIPLNVDGRQDPPASHRVVSKDCQEAIAAATLLLIAVSICAIIALYTAWMRVDTNDADPTSPQFARYVVYRWGVRACDAYECREYSYKSLQDDDGAGFTIRKKLAKAGSFGSWNSNCCLLATSGALLFLAYCYQQFGKVFRISSFILTIISAVFAFTAWTGSLALTRRAVEEDDFRSYDVHSQDAWGVMLIASILAPVSAILTGISLWY